MPTIGEVIKAARKEASLTQKQVAELAGLDVTYLANVEQDRYAELTTGTIRKLRVALPALSLDALIAAEPKEQAKAMGKRK